MNYIRYELYITLVGKNRLKYLKEYSEYIYKHTPDNSQFLKLEYVIDSYSTTKYIPHRSADQCSLVMRTSLQISVTIHSPIKLAYCCMVLLDLANLVLVELLHLILIGRYGTLM